VSKYSVVISSKKYWNFRAFLSRPRLYFFRCRGASRPRPLSRGLHHCCLAQPIQCVK